MTMGEGGFVACKSYETEVILRSFREWGRGCYCVGPEANKLKCGSCGKRFQEWIPEMKGEIFDHKYVYDEIGYNLKPIELQGAMGMVQLEKLETIHALRRRNYSLLFDIYSKYEEYFHLPRAQEYSDPSWFAFPLTIRAGSPFKRSDIVDYLEDKLIQNSKSQEIVETQCDKHKRESGEHLYLCFLIFILFGILSYDNQKFCFGECINNYEFY
jgi:CDP-6-deoxy-D-xylo-4-hexulose-3-dehydrase